MPTRNVVLTDHQAVLLERLVASGRYQNASEVLREGLRLLEQRDQEDQIRLQALKDAVALGVNDIDSGRYVTLGSNEDISSYLANLRQRT
ncbi:type II toxin-antitoxin system ParD family antitoxin [Sedimenticola hydrogenitrophicus]|uniref:type II toxin-antitoxin system ParD family antitoxin n=1 Tax=Sedimenticola hydrogenitrophicus TaxID=2967975 RepID=UPI0023AF5716|nr:type II toxin-antitoxin system ParD family antitoxin [Sedimenticola hydrogenitrophicus]